MSWVGTFFLASCLTAQQLPLVLTERQRTPCILPERQLAAQQRWQNAYQKAAQQRWQNWQELTHSVVAEMLSSFASVVAVLDTEQSGAGRVGLHGRPPWFAWKPWLFDERATPPGSIVTLSLTHLS